LVTLLRVLTDQRGWNDFDTFRTRYRTAAGDEARASGEPGLATLDLSEDTYDRWYAGMSTPQRGARRVLARLFGRTSGHRSRRSGTPDSAAHSQYGRDCQRAAH
jgi:hypothetical protein